MIFIFATTPKSEARNRIRIIISLIRRLQSSSIFGTPYEYDAAVDVVGYGGPGKRGEDRDAGAAAIALSSACADRRLQNFNTLHASSF